MTEKKKPHHDLNKIKEHIKNEKTRIILRTTRQNLHSLGFTLEEMVDIVCSLKISENFYKAMTTLKSSQEWQDVYKTTSKDIKLYIKFQYSKDDKTRVILYFHRDDEEGANHA